MSPEVAAEAAAAARAVLAKAGLSAAPVQSVSQMQEALATKDKCLAVQEAQLAALKKGLPEDVAEAAMKIGELEAKLAEEKKLAARRAAQVAELKATLPEDVAAQAMTCLLYTSDAADE